MNVLSALLVFGVGFAALATGLIAICGQARRSSELRFVRVRASRRPGR
jgi:hypothetical protein